MRYNIYSSTTFRPEVVPAKAPTLRLAWLLLGAPFLRHPEDSSPLTFTTNILVATTVANTLRSLCVTVFDLLPAMSVPFLTL